MKHHWRLLLSVLPKSTERKAFNRFFEKEHASWKSGNKQGDSNYTKQQVLRDISQRYGVRVLVETGTYLGDTIYALYNDFDEIYSVELSEHYFNKAKKRFSSYPKIKLVFGDSGEQLFRLVPQLQQPALFWLDGHYSAGLTAKGEKECPVYEELDAIFGARQKHYIVIDDARLFVGKNDYPKMEELRSYVAAKQPSYTVNVENDSIRIFPAR